MDNKTVHPVVLSYAGSRGRGNFIPPEHDLVEIRLISDVDGYVRQAFKKKLGLMFKEGYSYRGKNTESIRYVRERLEQIAWATAIPTIELKKTIGRDLISVSNAFLVKVRNSKASGGLKRKDGTRSFDPVAGYFPAPPETMFPEVNENGKVTRWKQLLPDGRFKLFSVDDVIHFVIDKRTGFIFGVPSIIPVIDDIRALRQIEENIEMLLYQCLFPLFQYKVGTKENPAGVTEDGKDEVAVVKEELQNMPLEGGIVTSERHEISAIGSEGRAIRAEGYLDHFKKRVVAGLGISQIDLGDGQTSNRSTAQTLSRALVDTVKDIQDSFEAQWDQMVVSELLLESSFPDPLSEENMVHLQFNEVDIVSKMEVEKHALELFQSNMIDWDEARGRLGVEPIDVPETPDDDPVKYKSWMRTNWKLFKEPENLIRAIDEAFSPASKQAAENRSLGTTSANVQEAGEDVRQNTREQAKQKTPPTKDSFLPVQFDILEEDLLLVVSTSGKLDRDYLLAYCRAWMTPTAERMESLAYSEYVRGFTHNSSDVIFNSRIIRERIRQKIDRRIEKLITDTVRLITRRIDAISHSVKLADILLEIRSSFESLKYRTRYIEDIVARRSLNWGKMTAISKRKGKMKIIPSEGCCDRCRIECERIGVTSYISFPDLNPFHAGCICKLVEEK